MSVKESFYVTIPSEYREFRHVSRVAPNEGSFPVDAEVHVRTESGHDMKFLSRQVGQSAMYLLAFISSEPPITERPVVDKEVWVEGNYIAIDKKFSLVSAFPVFKDQTDFVPREMTANIDHIDIAVED